MPISSRRQQNFLFAAKRPGNNMGLNPQEARDAITSTVPQTFNRLPQFTKHRDPNNSEAKKRALQKMSRPQ